MCRCAFGYQRILPCITVFFPLDFLPLAEYNKRWLEMANYF